MMFLTGQFKLSLLAHLLIAQQDAAANSFNELGSLFLWGIMGAIGVAAVVVVIWLRIQNSRTASASDYMSINPSKHGEQGQLD